MPSDSLYDRCASMSFSKLRYYIDSCLSALNSSRTDPNLPILAKEDFLKLLELLRAKASAPFPLQVPGQNVDVHDSLEAPQWFQEFVPSKHLKRLMRDLSQSQLLLSENHESRKFGQRRIEKLELKIRNLKYNVELLKSRELNLLQARYERSSAERSRFCDRIGKDIERTFVNDRLIPANKVFWRILPPGEWTVESVISHYSKIQRANPHVQFDVDRLRRIFSLTPSSLYVGIDEFEGYIVFVFSQTKKVVLECPIYGNAIYVIRENWENLSRLPKGELLARFPNQALRIVHVGDWYPRVRAELFSRVRNY
jgi:hypothetical protein